MRIAEMQMDDKGRVTFPSSFLKANGIDPKIHVCRIESLGREKAVRLTFIDKSEDHVKKLSV